MFNPCKLLALPPTPCVLWANCLLALCHELKQNWKAVVSDFIYTFFLLLLILPLESIWALDLSCPRVKDVATMSKRKRHQASVVWAVIYLRQWCSSVTPPTVQKNCRVWTVQTVTHLSKSDLKLLLKVVSVICHLGLSDYQKAVQFQSVPNTIHTESSTIVLCSWCKLKASDMKPVEVILHTLCSFH